MSVSHPFSNCYGDRTSVFSTFNYFCVCLQLYPWFALWYRLSEDDTGAAPFATRALCSCWLQTYLVCRRFFGFMQLHSSVLFSTSLFVFIIIIVCVCSFIHGSRCGITSPRRVFSRRLCTRAPLYDPSHGCTRCSCTIGRLCVFDTLRVGPCIAFGRSISWQWSQGFGMCMTKSFLSFFLLFVRYLCIFCASTVFFSGIFLFDWRAFILVLTRQRSSLCMFGLDQRTEFALVLWSSKITSTSLKKYQCILIFFLVCFACFVYAPQICKL